MCSQFYLPAHPPGSTYAQWVIHAEVLGVPRRLRAHATGGPTPGHHSSPTCHVKVQVTGWGGPSGVRLAAAWVDPPASFCGTTWVHPPDSMPIGEAAKGGWDLPVLSWGFPAALSHSSPVCQQPFVPPQPTPTTLLSNGDELHMFLGMPAQ